MDREGAFEIRGDQPVDDTVDRRPVEAQPRALVLAIADRLALIGISPEDFLALAERLFGLG